MLLGDKIYAENRHKIANIQSLSGTGALRIAMEFLREWYPVQDSKVWAPDPTWPTHHFIARGARF